MLWQVNVDGSIAFWLIIIILGIPTTHVALGYILKHPNKIHMYVKACHLSIASKSTSPWHLAPMVFSSLKLGFWLNPSASQLTLPALWTISKLYSYRISTHLANLLVSQFDFQKLQRLMIGNQSKWAIIQITLERRNRPNNNKGPPFHMSCILPLSYCWTN